MFSRGKLIIYKDKLENSKRRINKNNSNKEEIIIIKLVIIKIQQEDQKGLEEE